MPNAAPTHGTPQRRAASHSTSPRRAAAQGAEGAKTDKMTGIEDCRDRVPSSPPRGRLDSHLRAPASDWLQNEYIPFPNLPFSSSCRSSFCQFHFLNRPPHPPPELRERISAADFPLDNEILTSAAFHGSGVLRIRVVARPDEFSLLLGFHVGVAPSRGLAVQPKDTRAGILPP